MKLHAQINRLIDKQDSQVKAIASVSLDGLFAVHGIRVIENSSGRFANMPSTSYTDHNGETKYSDTFHPITKEAREAINRAVLTAYDQKLAQTQTANIEVRQDSARESPPPDETPNIVL